MGPSDFSFTYCTDEELTKMIIGNRNSLSPPTNTVTVEIGRTSIGNNNNNNNNNKTIDKTNNKTIDNTNNT